jgi:hypothetical protein
MRKWYLPMAVVGVGGLGALLLTYAGRRRLQWLWDNAQRAPETLLAWNEAAQRELDRIEEAVNRVAQSLDSAQ